MIDGSPDNSIFNLIFGYNGLGRIFGTSGAGRRRGGGATSAAPTGLLRLFNELMGGQASWLLPAALLALVVGLWATRRAPRTDRTRAALLLWGGWLLVTGLVFSSRQRRHPHLLHGRARARDRRAGRDRGPMLWKPRHALAARASVGAGGHRHRAAGPGCCSTAPRAGSRGCAC